MDKFRFWKESEPVRLYLYSVLVPVLLVLAAKGVIGNDDVALYSTVAAAALGIPVVEKVRSLVTPASAEEEDYEGAHRA